MLNDLSRAMSENYIKYKGCLIEKVWQKKRVTGFRYHGHQFATLIEVFGHIEKNFSSLEKSIKND